MKYYQAQTHWILLFTLFKLFFVFQGIKTCESHTLASISMCWSAQTFIFSQIITKVAQEEEKLCV